MKTNPQKNRLAKIICGALLASFCLSGFGSLAQACERTIREGKTCRVQVQAGDGKTLLMAVPVEKGVRLTAEGAGCGHVAYIQYPEMKSAWLGKDGATLAGGNVTYSFISISPESCALKLEAL